MLFCQKFRERDAFTKDKEVPKEIISRNFFGVRENFSFYHNVQNLKMFVIWLWIPITKSNKSIDDEHSN